MIREGLTFDDVLLIPQHSNIESRSKIDISVNMGFYDFRHPIIPANMKTITGYDMAVAIIKSGGLAILHRFMPLEEQLETCTKIIREFGTRNLAVSVGVKKEETSNIHKFLERDIKIFCIDVAHGDSDQCVEMIQTIKNIQPGAFVIAGNVATGPAAERLWLAGADAVKVGVGPGSLCTTRIETGNGVPQLTALMDVADVKYKLTHEVQYFHPDKKKYDLRGPIYIIADGGAKNAGDLVKALCFADMVMAGNLFAGCEETPSEMINIDGIWYKEYVGSSTHKTNHIEGVAALVQTKGSYNSVLTKLLEGLRSGCSYQGASNLEELKDNPTFIRITNAGLKESHPHDVIIR